MIGLALALLVGAIVAVPANATERDPFAAEVQETETSSSSSSYLGEIRVGARRVSFSLDAADNVIADEVGTSPAPPPGVTIVEALDLDAAGTFDLDFDRVDARNLLMVLAALVDENLVVAGDVRGEVSLHLNDVTFEEVLDLILFGHALDAHREGNIMLVAPEDSMARYREERLQNDLDIESLAPLVTRVVEVKHTQAKVLRDLLSGNTGQPPALSDRGSVLVDERTNTLILIDAAERIEAMRQIIRSIDVPVRQVLIEARVVNVDRALSAQTGVQWGFLRASQPASTTSGYEFEAGVGGPADVEVGFLRDRAALDVKLSAMASEGLVEIVARPKVITADQRRATVESGVEIPYQQATSSGATSTAFKEAVLQLEVTPRITPDDWISLDLEIKQDTIGAVFGGVPSVNTTKIITRVLVEDRQTVVLGGIAQTDRTSSVVKTPLLGEIPVLKHFFRQRVERDDEQDLLVFITPTILEIGVGSR